MANSSGGNSGNRRPKGSGNRSSSARRSGSPQGSSRPTRDPSAETEQEPEAKTADERARERLANKPGAKKRPQAGGPPRGGKPGQRRPSSKGKGRGRGGPQRSTGTIAAVAGSVVVAVFVVVVVLVSTLSSSASGSTTPFKAKPASAALVKGVTDIPESSFKTADTGDGTVGVSSELDETTGQAALKSNGLPELMYVGAEGCPYCAAARWPMIIALSRFGTFKGLGIIKSSPVDSWSNTNTWTFLNATYTSKYLTFDPTEEMSNVPCPSTPVKGCGVDQSWYDLQTPTKQVANIVKKYDTCSYFPDSGSPCLGGGIPFMDWAGKYVSSGGWYQPTVINPDSTPKQGKSYSWSQIEKFLTVPGSGEGQTILAAANIYSALICDITGNSDAAVCGTTEVKNANKLIKAQQAVKK